MIESTSLSPPTGPEDQGGAAVLGGLPEQQQLAVPLRCCRLLRHAEEVFHTQGGGQTARPDGKRCRVHVRTPPARSVSP